jgi:hypothetical protein
MKWIKTAALLGLVLVTNSCTVVGILADTAIQTVSDEHNNKRTAGSNIEPFFTKKGLEQDIKLGKVLMAKFPKKKVITVPKAVQRKRALACKNISDGQQQCYSPEYYKDMYIVDSPVN